MIRDLLLGLRLAVGGGRISGQALLRLAMTTLGVALVVAVLLPAASINTLVSEQDAREAAQVPQVEPRPGVDPLYRLDWFIDGGDDYLRAVVVAPDGPNAPVPPGLDRIPAPGEVVVSPAAADYLASPAGEPARARIGGTVVGEVGKAGLGLASDRVVYVGDTAERLKGEDYTTPVYGFGAEPDGLALDITTAAFVAPVAVVLLLPLLIFVTTASRMGAAQRERRLAALRLLGVSGRQVRRIAAAESLVGAVAGLVLGGALFLALRPLIGHLDLFGMRFFPEDFVPSWPLVVVIALLVPGLAVGAAIFGLRRTIVEPLGVVRQGKPARRRMWWRWSVAALGGLLMAGTLLADERSNATPVGLALAAGSSLLLIGVAALLPWAVEKLVAGLRGGTPAWQLAVRRLQLESGTASRVVSGLVIVLAGAILIQTLVGAVSATESEGSRWQAATPVAAQVVGDDEQVDEAASLLAGTDGITAVHEVVAAPLRAAGDGSGWHGQVLIGDCAALASRAELGTCADGDVFSVGALRESSGLAMPEPGARVRFYSYGGDGEQTDGPQWTLPAEVRQVPADQAAREVSSILLVTPGALGGVTPSDAERVLYVTGTGAPARVFEAASLAVGPLSWEVDVRPALAVSDSSRLDETTRTMRGMLLVASIFVLAVAALSLLMLSIEQIVERRRPLAALSAAGVPLSVLARGSLWQNAIPVAIGVVLAVVAGIGITLPTLRYAGLSLSLDAGLIGIVCGAAVLAVLAATALTLPLLRQVTRLDGLRAE
ncbi:FtsX-like permease family protein [Prauserella endophytica]|uniref:FtsX-like permease family protein n=1 Tax=Prauserella endophytica TaxID=1592324 RepID=A0ABY2SA10_9PSEU|nr:FtsX-like permease family protein [Prauserella endophytica]TKG72728.1 FtsX-like permease family protein [Prauserella endophytica]